MNQDEIDTRLGAAIRSLRHHRRRTLVELADATGLSHPFLSQVERGRARPSIRSLFLIAEALGTTQQALLAAASPSTSEPPLIGTGTRLLLHEETADVTEFSDIGPQFGDFFVHARSELLYVVAGKLELETRPSQDAKSRFAILGPRESAVHAGGTLHRFRRFSSERCIVLMVHGDHHDQPPAQEE